MAFKQFIVEEEMVFNSWTTIAEVPRWCRNTREREVYCQCECGTVSKVGLKNLLRGNSKTCHHCRTKKSVEVCTQHWVPIIKEDYALVPLNKGVFTKVDISDLDALMKVKWTESSQGYAVTSGRGEHKEGMMHRVLLGVERSDLIVHHINGDKLDNRITNLVVLSRSEHIDLHRVDLEEARGITRDV